MDANLSDGMYDFYSIREACGYQIFSDFSSNDRNEFGYSNSFNISCSSPIYKRYNEPNFFYSALPNMAQSQPFQNLEEHQFTRGFPVDPGSPLPIGTPLILSVFLLLYLLWVVLKKSLFSH